MTRAGRNGERRDGSSWYRISNSGSGPAQIMMYDLIGAWGITAKDFLRDLAAVGDGPVDVHIASDGGDVFEAYAIYTALASRPGVTTVVDSLAASCASVIAMAGEQRLMSKLSQMMIHDAWAGVDGNADDLQHMIGRLNTVSEQIAQVYADAAGGTPEYWRGLMKAETWFTPQQALEAGLITGITGSAREPAPAGTGASAADRGGVILAAAGDNAGWVQRGGKWEFDPDGDGDDDSSASTDTDHSHWAADGTQLKAIPPNPATGKGGKPMAPSDRAAPGPQDAKVDNSPWDAGKAWSNGANSDDPAAFYNGICAGKKAGDPKTQEAHALPHHYHPGDPPNAGGTRAALGRLPGTDGLTNKAQAQAHLEAHMKVINPDYEPGNSAGNAPVPAARTDSAAPPAPGSQARQPTAGKDERKRDMPPEDANVLTVEGRRARITDIVNRCQDLAREYTGLMPPEVQAEWDSLVRERRDHTAAIEAHDARNAQLADMTAAGIASLADRPLTPQGGAGTFGAPAVHIQQDDIYDLAAIRDRARSMAELPGLLRDNALRAVEQARFPGAASRETAQANVARLLDNVPDDVNGALARRILSTGSPGYKRVFGKALASGNPGGLTGNDARILALGESDTGAYAVPFELDPTVILTSNGAINPLRQIARVERITGKEYDLVTSTGVTVHRRGEFSASTNDAPTLAQPTVKPERVDGFIPFSVEIEGDWTALQATMLRLLTDAKDVEEATGPAGFVLGSGVNSGTAPQAGGIITTLSTASQVPTATTATFAVGDVYAIKNATPPRFRAQGSFLAESSIYDLVRQFGTGTMANVWVDLGGDRPSKLIGYPARELSAMQAATSPLVTGQLILLFGDFQQFLIVDRIGMNMELVPHVADPSTGYPTGTRGYYCWWRNNSVILTSNAFRLLKIK